jgi:hypothetical protein
VFAHKVVYILKALASEPQMQSKLLLIDLTLSILGPQPTVQASEYFDQKFLKDQKILTINSIKNGFNLFPFISQT